MKRVKGYKAFNKDMTCRSMKYEIGKEYKMKEKPILCGVGYHFCKTIADCYRYYSMDEDTIICEIRALGDIVSGGRKFCTNHILIVRKINNPRKKTNVSISSGYCNTGYDNDGNLNTGDRNAGNWNTGNANTGSSNTGDANTGNANTGSFNGGNWNTGLWNTGDNNTGDCNTGNNNTGDNNTGLWNTGDNNTGDWNAGNNNAGDCNSGDRNTGNYNTGDCNSGDRNTGDWNAGDWNAGIFCTEKKPKIKLFDKESDWTMDDWLKSVAKHILDNCPHDHNVLVDKLDMTDDEKEKHPEYNTIGGYYKTVLVTAEDKQSWWNDLSVKDKNTVCSLPNFNKNIFKKCTGIEV